jgi:molybdopterin converting factor small subunit
MPISVSVRLFLGPRQRDRRDGEERIVSLPEGSTVRSVLDRFGVPDAQPMIILRNNSHAVLEDKLASGDALVILPPLDGG